MSTLDERENTEKGGKRMVRTLPTKIKEYELKDSRWWMGRHKENLSYMCIRIDQLLKAMEEDDIDRIESLSMIIRVALKNLNDSGIGLYQVLPEEEE
tara:strand:+ start:1502 stop:1792 length:291 start_codon:yes stop_codon:yes gene_type:complete